MAMTKAKATMTMKPNAKPGMTMAKSPGYKKTSAPAKPEKVTRESALNATYTGMATMPKSAVKAMPKRGMPPMMGVGMGKGRGAKSRMKR
jgi:hypothetical protein